VTTGDELKRKVRDIWHAAWDLGEVAALDDLLAPDYRRYGRTSPDGQTREELKASITACRRAFPDLTTVIDDIVGEPGRLAVRWHSGGTHTGSMLGVPPTGRTVAVSGATFARVVDGLIVTEHVTWDPRELLEALGIITVGAGTPAGARTMEEV
jgi:steroid delta-isomerase-like uncharacterized protein